MVHLIITVRTHPGRVGEYIDAFLKLAAAVRSEPGCIAFEIYRDSEDPRFDNQVRPDTAIICEKWESIEALQAHSHSSLALAEFRRVVKDIKLDSSYILLSPAMLS